MSDQRAFRTESVPDTGTFSSSRDKILHIWSLVGDNAYTFKFSADRPIYKEYLPTIERMVNSFRFC